MYKSSFVSSTHLKIAVNRVRIERNRSSVIRSRESNIRNRSCKYFRMGHALFIYFFIGTLQNAISFSIVRGCVHRQYRCLYDVKNVKKLFLNVCCKNKSFYGDF